MKYRCDRLAWAVAVLAGELWWTFQGVDDPDRDTLSWPRRGNREAPVNKLAASLRGSERYMNQYFEDELQALIDDHPYSSSKDEWEEHCRDSLHGEGLCPHSPDEEERKRYHAAYEKKLNNKDALEEWHRERLNEDWYSYGQRVDEDCCQIEFVEWFLKEHPIDGCVRYLNGEYFGKVDLEDIVGYCPECNQPATQADLGGEGKDPWFFTCYCCNTQIDNIAPEEDYIQAYGRPFYWPPDAPFPPRRHFDGTPLDVPFYED